MATYRGLVPNMRIVSLLFFWSLPFLSAGGQEQSSGSQFPNAAQVVGRTYASVQHAPDESFPGNPRSVNWAQSLAEDDDSLEDGSLDIGPAAGWQSPALKLGNLSTLAPLQHVLLRTPSSPHPLRC